MDVDWEEVAKRLELALWAIATHNYDRTVLSPDCTAQMMMAIAKAALTYEKAMRDDKSEPSPHTPTGPGPDANG